MRHRAASHRIRFIYRLAFGRRQGILIKVYLNRLQAFGVV
jgi:hypothetical protein